MCMQIVIIILNIYNHLRYVSFEIKLKHTQSTYIAERKNIKVNLNITINNTLDI